GAYRARPVGPLNLVPVVSPFKVRMGGVLLLAVRLKTLMSLGKGPVFPTNISLLARSSAMDWENFIPLAPPVRVRIGEPTPVAVRLKTATELAAAMFTTNSSLLATSSPRSMGVNPVVNLREKGVLPIAVRL